LISILNVSSQLVWLLYPALRLFSSIQEEVIALLGFLANCMCFSAHDIYPENQENCFKFILRILKESENTILITSKPNLRSIKYLCENLEVYR